MKKRNIVLIGPMGTGKSRAARILADGLGWQLADTDRIMERMTGEKIADYWRNAGPEIFLPKQKWTSSITCAITMRLSSPWEAISP